MQRTIPFVLLAGMLLAFAGSSTAYAQKFEPLHEGAVKVAQALATNQACGETELVPFETSKLGGKLATSEKMRTNPARSIGFSAVDAAAKINRQRR